MFSIVILLSLLHSGASDSPVPRCTFASNEINGVVTACFEFPGSEPDIRDIGCITNNRQWINPNATLVEGAYEYICQPAVDNFLNLTRIVKAVPCDKRESNLHSNDALFDLSCNEVNETPDTTACYTWRGQRLEIGNSTTNNNITSKCIRGDQGLKLEQFTLPVFENKKCYYNGTAYNLGDVWNVNEHFILRCEPDWIHVAQCKTDDPGRNMFVSDNNNDIPVEGNDGFEHHCVRNGNSVKYWKLPKGSQ